MASGSAICDGVVTLLTATSMLGASMATVNNWKVLEKTSGSCAVVSITGLSFEPTTFGTNKDQVWTIAILGYIKDTNHPTDDLSKINTMITSFADAIASDDTLQGTVGIVRSFRATRRAGDRLEIGGALWHPVEMFVEAIVLT